MRWAIRIWPGPSADGLDRHLAPNAAMPSMDPRMARHGTEQTASTDTEFGSLGPSATSAPAGGCDQMLSVHVAASGGILLHTARRPTPSVPSVQGATKR